MANPDAFDPNRIPDMTIPDRTDDRSLPAASAEKVPPALPTDSLKKLAPWDEPPASPAAAWQVGAQVWAPWEPEFAYPGVIGEISAGGKQALIEYSDDGRGWVLLEQLQPLNLQRGQKLQCRRDRGAFFFPATIVDLQGGRVRVRYDDNHDEEWTIIAALRLAIDDTGPGAEMLDFGHGLASPKNLRSGDRVWAPWEASVLYPATVDRMSGGRAYVRYDDGSEAWVMKEQLLPLDIPVGLRLLSRRATNGDWQPGTVLEADGAEVLIEFTQGGTKWVGLASLALPTVPLGPDAQPARFGGAWHMPNWAWWALPLGAIVISLTLRGCSMGH